MDGFVKVTFHGGAWDGEKAVFEKKHTEVKLYTRVGGQHVWAVYRSQDGQRFDFVGYDFNYPGVSV